MLSPRNKNLWIHSLRKTWKNTDPLSIHFCSFPSTMLVFLKLVSSSFLQHPPPRGWPCSLSQKGRCSGTGAKVRSHISSNRLFLELCFEAFSTRFSQVITGLRLNCFVLWPQVFDLEKVCRSSNWNASVKMSQLACLPVLILVHCYFPSWS